MKLVPARWIPDKEERSPETYYDLEVEDTHCYFADDILVSNSHIELAEPVPNPLFEKAIKALTGLSASDYEDLVSGKKGVTESGDVVPADKADYNGGRAVEHLLKRIDRDRELDDLLNRVSSARGTSLDKIIKKVKILRALKQADQQPTVYLSKLLPVLPPTFRPFTVTGSGDISMEGLTAIYKAIALDNEQLKTFPAGLPDEEKNALRAEIYDGLKSLAGLGGYLNSKEGGEIGGILDILHGSEIKYGFFQRGLIKRRLDMTARGVITPDLDVGFDELGVPYRMAKVLYEPFLVRTMTQPPYSLAPLHARELIDGDSETVRRVLDIEMAKRPLAMKRDPVLHKHGIMGMYAHVVPGKSIRVNPLVCEGYNADFDGNCIIGSSKVVLTFPMPSDIVASLSSFNEVYGMRLKGDELVTITNDNEVVVELAIEEFLCIDGTGKACKDGSTQFQVPPGIRCLSYDHLTGEQCWADITAFTVQDDHPCQKVTTRGGLEVTVSDNESLCVFDHETGGLKKIRPADSTGTLSPVVRDVRDVRGDGDVGLGWMIGAFASDGFLMGDSDTFGYSKCSDAHRARFAAEVRRFEGSWVKYNTYRETKSEQKFSDSVKDHFYHAKKALAFFKQFYTEKGEGRSALYKRLPDLTDYPVTTLKGILAGLLDGDGSVSVSNSKDKPQLLVNFSTSSTSLKDGVMELLRRLGVKHSCTPYQPKGEGRHPAYLINISTPDLLVLAPELDLVTEEYSKALSKFDGNSMRNDWDIVPVPSSIMNLCASVKGPCEPKLRAVLSTIKFKTRPFFYVSRALAKRMLLVLGASAGQWAILVNADRVHWDINESCEPAGSHRVYDFEVPSTKVFALASGLVIYDTVSLYVPVTDDAVEDVKRMLPSRILKFPASGKEAYTPKAESVMGLYLLTKFGKETSHSFKTESEVLDAYKADKVAQDDVVRLAGSPTTPGRVVVANVLPAGKMREQVLFDKDFVLSKSNQAKLFHEYSNDPEQYARIADRLKNMGYMNATARGWSFSLKDAAAVKHIRDRILSKADIEASHIPAKAAGRDKKLVEIYSRAADEMEKELTEHLGKTGNKLFDAYKAGAKMTWTNLRQVIATPMLTVGPKGPVPHPIRHSFSEGLDTGEYWISQLGGRKAMFEKTQEVSIPGAINKQLANLVMDTVIMEPDCGTKIGVSTEVGPDVIDRFTAEPIRLKTGQVIPANTVINPQVLGELMKDKKDRIQIRSPLRCSSSKGICAHCFGRSPAGGDPQIGDNVGIVATTGFGERGVQLAMRSFHCNHAKSLVFAKQEDSAPITVTMEDLFELMDTPIDCANDLEWRAANGWKVWDERWVDLLKVSRHTQNRPMMFVSDAGFATICQDNHPLAVYPNQVSCVECGYHRLKWHRKNGEKCGQPYCPKCGVSQNDVDPVGEVEFLGPAEITPKRYFLLRDVSVIEQFEKGVPPDIDPYAVGMFLSEGCIGYRACGKGKEKKPYSVEFTQNPGEVRDKLEQRLSDLGKLDKSYKNIRIHSLELGRSFEELFGRYSRNMALPVDFLDYPSEWLVEVVAGVIDGDGTLKCDPHGPDAVGIDTTSFELAQQLVLVLAKLGVKAWLLATPVRELTRNQGFKVEFCVTENVWKLFSNVSIKLRSRYPNSDAGSDPILHGHRWVSVCKPVMYTDRYVYDVTTETGTLIVSGLKSHNSAGAVGGNKGILSSIGRLKQLLNMPEVLPGAATLAEEAGKVTRIEKDPAGGFGVYVDNQRHYVPTGHVLKVKIGDTVKKGDPVDDGPLNPHELARLVGIPAVQRYLTDEIQNLYRSEGVKRIHAEVLVRSLTNLGKVVDQGDHPDLLPTDTTSIQTMERWNREHPKEKPVKYEPVLKGAEILPLEMHQDWLARLAYRRQADTITQGTIEGWNSDIHGTHPIPGIVYGSEFGLPKDPNRGPY